MGTEGKTKRRGEVDESEKAGGEGGGRASRIHTLTIAPFRRLDEGCIFKRERTPAWRQ